MARQDPLRNFNFRVEIDGIASAGFSDVSGLESKIAVVEYREGTDPTHVRKLSGLTSHSNVVLKRGIAAGAGGLELWKWFLAVSNGDLKNHRRTVAIVLQDESRQDQVRWIVREAWPVKLEGPVLNAKGNEVAIESLELANEGILIEV